MILEVAHTTPMEKKLTKSAVPHFLAEANKTI